MAKLLCAACLLALLSAPARAGGSEDCLALSGLGCYFDGGNDGLLIYLRGHLHGSGRITGEGPVLASSRQAFDFYGLRSAAQNRNLTVMVTGSSHLPVLPADVAALEKRLGRKFGKVLVAAHSGGYVGLAKSLEELPKVDGIVLLDDFYGDVAGMARRVAGRDAPCAGFRTPHNKARFAAFTGTSCVIDAARSDAEHEPRVARCLTDYLDGRACSD
ncbi:MAG: hypothetical protein WC969_11870 [Elusimicrobiota bacterium]|jgi:hypothetical protein